MSDRPILLDPTGGTAIEKVHPANRLPSLDGKVLGILVNAKPNADVLFDMIEKRLCERHAIKKVVWGKKEFVGHRAPPGLVESMASECDAVITGTGD
jgi:hypothetical protein